MIRLHIVTPPVGWTARKAQMMTQEIRMLMAREGAPNSEVHVEMLDGSDSHGAVKADLILRCNKCPEAKWTAPVFCPCPECGGKMSVFKITKEQAALEISDAGTDPAAHPITFEPRRRPGRPKGSKNRKKKPRGRRAKQMVSGGLAPYTPEQAVTQET